MATTITGKLNKPANIFQAGDSTGFGVRVGVKCRDPKTKADAWANYSAVIFAKSPGQIQFYTEALIEGSVIEISAENLLVDSFDGKDGPVLTINMLNARLGYVHTGQSQAPQQQGGFQHQQSQQHQAAFKQQAQQQGGFQQQAPVQQGGFSPQQQAPQRQQATSHNFNNNQQQGGGYQMQGK
jgi:single-strand DNA-binding protein